MKKFLVSVSIILFIGLAWLIPSPNEVFAAEGTDRMIVKLVDKDGNESIESISIEEINQFKEGKPLNASSRLHNAQQVEVLEPDFIRQVALQTKSVQAKSWGTKRVGVENLKNQVALLNGTVIVAVIDTGVDYTHTFLKDRIVKGYDFVGNHAQPMDVHIHGTHVAGIIADTTPANVKIMPIRALDEEGKGYDSHVAQGVRFAVDNGAAIINMSFGGNEFSQYLSDAIEYAHSKNVLVVVASGNESGDTANYYPASDQKVLVVSAVDQNDTIASFSNTGSSVDVSAPGVSITSSVPGDRFETHSGTSLAAPYVSGIAAMLKLDGPVRSAKGLERLIKMHVDDRGTVGWDSLYGTGIVNFATYSEGFIVNESPVVTKEEKVVAAPMNSSKFIALTEHKNVPLNKIWTIKFDRRLTNSDVITIKLYNGDKEIPITLTSNFEQREIKVSASAPYNPQTAYRLVIDVEKGEKYQMDFVTGL